MMFRVVIDGVWQSAQPICAEQLAAMLGRGRTLPRLRLIEKAP